MPGKAPFGALRTQFAFVSYRGTPDLRTQGIVADAVLADEAGAIEISPHGMGGTGRIDLKSIADGVFRGSHVPSCCFGQATSVLLFVVGLKLDPHLIRGSGGPALIIGAIQMALTFSLAFGLV